MCTRICCLLLFFWILLDKGVLLSLHSHSHSMVGKLHHRSTVGLRRGAPGSQRVRRSWVWNQFFVLEEYMGSDPQYVGKLHTDLDRGNSAIKYILSGEGAGSIFTIDQATGDIHALSRLDRETKPYYTLHAQAVDVATGRPLEPESEFVIKVQDINDNEPKFLEGPYSATVPEMSPIGTYVTQITATDADDPTYGTSAQVVYSMLHGQPYFSIDPKTGVIRTALPNMDRELRENYQVLIQAKDMGGQLGGLAGTTVVNISLSDVNDNPPRFSKSVFHLRVPESSPTGSTVGRIKAHDLDTGKNAVVEYAIVPGEASTMFDITTNKHNQEGIIVLKKMLDYEMKKAYTFKVEASNVHLDQGYSHVGSLKDTATVKVSVLDVAEPPVFSKDSYTIEAYEDTPVGIIIGAVTAQDLDVASSAVRYSIDCTMKSNCYFDIDPVKGTISTFEHLDREHIAQHTVSIVATKVNNPFLASHAVVTIHVLDVNEFAPELTAPHETFVCENARDGKIIEIIGAQDKDLPTTTQRYTFRLPPQEVHNNSFRVWDFGNNTAGILTQQGEFRRQVQALYLLPVVITDSGYPVLSSTNTLTIRVCACGRSGIPLSCNSEAFLLPMGLSTGALVAILLCISILLVTMVLYVGIRHKRKKGALMLSKEDVRDNVINYDDEGGGEEDTHAFDMGALRSRRISDGDLLQEATLEAGSRWIQERVAVQDYIHQRLQDHTSDTNGPPYDSLATYGYEGDGSLAGSLSPIESQTASAEEDLKHLRELGSPISSLIEVLNKLEVQSNSTGSPGL